MTELQSSFYLKAWTVGHAVHPCSSGSLDNADSTFCGLIMLLLQGIPLAVKALHQLNQQEMSRTAAPRLVVAGGFDKRLAENREHFTEVRQLVDDLGLQQQVRSHSASPCAPCNSIGFVIISSLSSWTDGHTILHWCHVFFAASTRQGQVYP